MAASAVSRATSHAPPPPAATTTTDPNPAPKPSMWGRMLSENLQETRRANLEARSRGVTKKRRTQLVGSYLPDWIITLGLLLLFYMLDRVTGYHREFDINDTTIAHTFAETERVPIWMLTVIVLVFPAVVMTVVSGSVLCSFWDIHNSLLGLLLSFALTTATTVVVKITVGRPRPDMLDRCQPLPGTQNQLYPTYGLTSDVVCTATDLRKLDDGFRSFPSGHASVAWGGLAFFAFWIAGKVHLFDRRGHSLKAWITVTPFVAAALISISRTMDNRHHWQDVTVGSLIGLAYAYFSYRLYFPPLDHPLAHRPYSPRVVNDEVDLDEARGNRKSSSQGSTAPLAASNDHHDPQHQHQQRMDHDVEAQEQQMGFVDDGTCPRPPPVPTHAPPPPPGSNNPYHQQQAPVAGGPDAYAMNTMRSSISSSRPRNSHDVVFPMPIGSPNPHHHDHHTSRYSTNSQTHHHHGVNGTYPSYAV